NMSRTRLSVPNSAPAPGGVKRRRGFTLSGLPGEITGASSASAAKRTSAPSAIIAVGLRRNRRAAEGAGGAASSARASGACVSVVVIGPAVSGLGRQGDVVERIPADRGRGVPGHALADAVHVRLGAVLDERELVVDHLVYL